MVVFSNRSQNTTKIRGFFTLFSLGQAEVCKILTSSLVLKGQQSATFILPAVIYLRSSVFRPKGVPALDQIHTGREVSTHSYEATKLKTSMYAPHRIDFQF